MASGNYRLLMYHRPVLQSNPEKGRGCTVAQIHQGMAEYFKDGHTRVMDVVVSPYFTGEFANMKQAFFPQPGEVQVIRESRIFCRITALVFSFISAIFFGLSGLGYIFFLSQKRTGLVFTRLFTAVILLRVVATVQGLQSSSTTNTQISPPVRIDRAVIALISAPV